MSSSTEQQREAEKMRRISGIAFSDEDGIQVPKVAGTGLDVWEVIDVYLRLARDASALTAHFDWLQPRQLQAALRFYAACPAAVDAEIAENSRVVAELERDGRYMPSSAGAGRK
ncbi:MAG: DUF433 domain-containing protein [Dehalococcoidia bacterium]